MSNKLKGNTQKNNMGKRKQIIGYITDFVMLVDFLILAVSGFFVSNRFVTIRTGSWWWMIHFVTAILFVLLIILHVILHIKMIRGILKGQEPFSKKRKTAYILSGTLAAGIFISVMIAGGVSGGDTDAVSSATTSQNRNENIVEGVSPSRSTDSDINGIFSRTTTRVYSEEQVDEKLINTIIQAAFASPSGGGQYANEYIVVDDRDIMKQMMEANPYAQALETAPVVIVIAGNTNNAYYEDLLMFDAGIAAQSIMVEASELGLSSVPMSIAPSDARMKGVAAALNLPDGVEAQMMVAIGYPYMDAYTSASVTYYNQGEVHYNTWE